MKKILMQGANSFSKRAEKLFSEEYKATAKYLEAFYKDKQKIPSKIGLTEEENLNYDSNRLDYINRALDFLLKYYAPGSSPIIGSLSIGEQEFFEGLRLINSRCLIEHIAFTIYHLSGSLRVKYKHLLTPAPFTWETFELLGGLMKTAPPAWLYILLSNVSGEAAKRLIDEHLEVELIVEAATPTILQQDMPKLKQLFVYISDCEKQSTTMQQTFEPISLIAIKALTRRITDTENLIDLLKYADNHCAELDQQEMIAEIKKKGKADQLYMFEVEKNDKKFIRQFNLNTKLSRHAALRRLEKIGELITGKNFSSFLKELDTSVDWQAFVTIRDAITHQDERDNKAKIDNLLKDDELFKIILRDEMSEFFDILTKIIDVRDKTLPQFHKENIELFWHKIFLHEQKVQDEFSKNNKKQQTEQPQLRATKDDILIFISSLKNINAPIEIQVRWLGILNGIQPVPNKTEYGQLLQYLPSRKDSKELYKKHRKIADNAINPRSDLASRDLVRQQEQALAKKREEEQERSFKGLSNLRKFSKSLDPKNFNDYGLTRKQRVDAAIEALESIKEFMESDEFVQANFNFTNVKEWGENQNKETILNFFARLMSSPEFSDAIEYNAAQLLQHLDTIRKFPEATDCRFLDKNYDDLRYLRNHIEHGNKLFDKEEYEPGKEPSILSFGQQKVGPIMITLIFELLPNLKIISQAVSIQKDLPTNRSPKDTEPEKIIAPVNAAPKSSFYGKKMTNKDKQEEITEKTPNFVSYYLALKGTQ